MMTPLHLHCQPCVCAQEVQLINNGEGGGACAASGGGGETGRLQFGGLAVWGRQTVDPTGTNRHQQAPRDTNGFKKRLTFRQQWVPRG